MFDHHLMGLYPGMRPTTRMDEILAFVCWTPVYCSQKYKEKAICPKKAICTRWRRERRPRMMALPSGTIKKSEAPLKRNAASTVGLRATCLVVSA